MDHWCQLVRSNLCFRAKLFFEFQKKDGMNIEDLELELIDAGLEEIEEVDGVVYANADYTNFGLMSQALEALKIEVTKANLQRIPNTPVEFTEEQLVDIEKLIDKIEDDDDIQSVL